jgi:nicotinate-nucleotide--dimethylbenzimidazole phosphoribosyltransferase
VLRGKPTRVMVAMGGAEIATMVGGMMKCSDQDMPVLVDRFNVTTTAMIACMMDPSTLRLLLFAMQLAKRGQAVALGVVHNIATSRRFLSPTPPALDIGLRMDKAMGALFALPLMRSACTVMSELATLNKVFGHAPSVEI